MLLECLRISKPNAGIVLQNTRTQYKNIHTHTFTDTLTLTKHKYSNVVLGNDDEDRKVLLEERTQIHLQLLNVLPLSERLVRVSSAPPSSRSKQLTDNLTN